MRFSATAALSAAALLTGTVNADAQSVLSEASSSVASDASSVASSATTAPELPTFTVRSLPARIGLSQTSYLAIEMLTTLSVAHKAEGRLHRAIHRRLGGTMEAISRQEGYQGL
jgi:hypothetical protein